MLLPPMRLLILHASSTDTAQLPVRCAREVLFSLLHMSLHSGLAFCAFCGIRGRIPVGYDIPYGRAEGLGGRAGVKRRQAGGASSAQKRYTPSLLAAAASCVAAAAVALPLLPLLPPPPPPPHHHPHPHPPPPTPTTHTSTHPQIRTSTNPHIHTSTHIFPPHPTPPSPSLLRRAQCDDPRGRRAQLQRPAERQLPAEHFARRREAGAHREPLPSGGLSCARSHPDKKPIYVQEDVIYTRKKPQEIVL